MDIPERLMAYCLCMALMAAMLNGCDSRGDMRRDYGDGVHVFTDDRTGEKFIVKHHMGDCYTLERLDNAE